uniref:Uncharacterized protein n=1 Tax=Setaria digitata TaxID=48799 RepID=A0A915PVY6_9BILA
MWRCFLNLVFSGRNNDRPRISTVHQVIDCPVYLSLHPLTLHKAALYIPHSCLQLNLLKSVKTSSSTTAFSRAAGWLCCGTRSHDDDESSTYDRTTSARLSSSVTQGGQQYGRKISPVGKLQVVEHIVSPKYETLPADPVMDHLASFDSFSDLGKFGAWINI